MINRETSMNSLCDDNQNTSLFEEEYLESDPFAHWHQKEPELEGSIYSEFKEEQILKSRPELKEENKFSQSMPPTLMQEENSDEPLSHLMGSSEKLEQVLPDNNLNAQPQKEKEPNSYRGRRYPKNKTYLPGENAKRADVVCKSIIRAIKRHYCNVFCKGKSMINSLKRSEAKDCLDAIEKYCILHFKGTFGFHDDENILTIHELLSVKSKTKTSDLSEGLRVYYEIKIMMA